MKHYRIIFALATAALLLGSCAPKARINGKITGMGKDRLVVSCLDMNVVSVLDTITTKSDGSFSYSLDIQKGQPEFLYLYKGETRIASLLLASGETVKVISDTLGNYEVSGSEESQKLQEVEKRYSDFLREMSDNASDPQALGKIYLAHYRECVKYVMANTKSLTVIPVLYEKLSDEYPVFFQTNDAIFFRNALDSLKESYPESRYVKALEQETNARVKTMIVNTALENAPVSSIPDVSLPDMKGRKVSLSSLDSKAILIHFWDSSDAVQKMFNVDVLLPLYNEFHSRGFEIFSICLDTDKAGWGSVVTAQKLPWINVNDGKGAACPAMALYGVSKLPTSLLVVDGELVTSNTSNINGAASLKSELRRILQ